MDKCLSVMLEEKV